MNPRATEIILGPVAPGDALAPPGQMKEEKGSDVKYLSVPPKKSVTVSVRYQLRGRGLPLPYQLDEGMDV